MRDFKDYVISENIIYNKLILTLNKESNSCNKEYFVSDNEKCIVDGCTCKKLSRGFCNAHYIRYKQGKDLSKPLKNSKNSIICIECGVRVTSKGGFNRCVKHFKTRRKELIKLLFISLFDNKCLICNQQYELPIFDFHHIDKTTKEGAISDIIANKSIKDMSRELSKCVLLCANCHRLFHYNENKDGKEI